MMFDLFDKGVRPCYEQENVKYFTVTSCFFMEPCVNKMHLEYNIGKIFNQTK